VELLVLIHLLRAALESGDFTELSDKLADTHPADLAAAFAEFSPAHQWLLLKQYSVPRQAEIFVYLPLEQQVELALSISRKQITPLIRQMSSDERADLFNKFSVEQKQALLPALAQAERDDILSLSAYSEGSAGAIMSSDYAMLSPQLTASEAIEVLRHEAPDKETIYLSYVVDQQRRLIGALSLRELILAPASHRIDDVMKHDPIQVQVDTPQEEVAARIARYDLLAIPVVNDQGQLVGIVTHDDAMDVATQEATEDFHKTATIGKLDGSVKDAAISLLYRKRVVWLVVLVFGNIFSGAGLALFESVIAHHITLLFFLPLLIASSGNAGAQSGTLMVRALATGDVKLRDWGSMLGKEVLIAGLLGLTMAAAVSGLGFWRGGADISAVVTLTMLLVVLIGSLVGLSLPFLLSRFGLDPATASGPLITSIADVTGVVIYFSIASWYLDIGF